MNDPFEWYGIALLVTLVAVGAGILWLNDRSVQRRWNQDASTRGQRFTHYRWRWIGSPPPVFNALVWLCAAHMSIAAAFLVSISLWATTRPDVKHTEPIKMRGSKTYYAPPAVGRYIQYALPAGFILVAMAGGVMWWYRERVERA
jgi:hypothetical protein